MFLKFIIEKLELLGPLKWIFPFRNKVDEPVGQCFRNLFSRAAKLGSPMQGKPSDEARTLVPQIAKNRWFVLGVV